MVGHLTSYEKLLDAQETIARNDDKDEAAGVNPYFKVKPPVVITVNQPPYLQSCPRVRTKHYPRTASVELTTALATLYYCTIYHYTTKPTVICSPRYLQKACFPAIRYFPILSSAENLSHPALPNPPPPFPPSPDAWN